MDITNAGPLLTLSGSFDVRCTGQVRNAVYEQLAGYDSDVVIDMSEVPTIDATAFRVLVVATRYAGMTGHHLTLRNPSESVRRMLLLCRLAHAVEVERIEATA